MKKGFDAESKKATREQGITTFSPDDVSDPSSEPLDEVYGGVVDLGERQILPAKKRGFLATMFLSVWCVGFLAVVLSGVWRGTLDLTQYVTSTAVIVAGVFFLLVTGRSPRK